MSHAGAGNTPSASHAQQQRWPRGAPNALHKAAFNGFAKMAIALLSSGSIDVDQGTPDGFTALTMAARNGHPRVVRILLDHGANASIVDDCGYAALHACVECGNTDEHLAVIRTLANDGVDLDLPVGDSLAGTALHLAARRGRSEVMSVLIEAGANPNSRAQDGATPLYVAAQQGHLNILKMLLRAKADPVLARKGSELPLGAAAAHGRAGVARELIRQFGIEGCGGESVGQGALDSAAASQHVNVMAVLTDAGVVDAGSGLLAATAYGREEAVKFLLRQKEEEPADDQAAYVNYRNRVGVSPLLCAAALIGCPSPRPRIVRLLIDHGANTTMMVQVEGDGWSFGDNETPLDITTRTLRGMEVDGKDAKEEQLNGLEGIRRVLLRVEAARAVSLLWPVGTHTTARAAEGTRRTGTTSAPLRMMLPILRRRARTPRVLLAALFRWVVS